MARVLASAPGFAQSVEELTPEELAQRAVDEAEAFKVTSADVNAERARRIAAGVTVTIEGYGAVPIQGGVEHEVNLLGLEATAKDMVAAGVADPVLVFRDADNSDHTLTPAQMLELVRAGKNHKSALMQASWVLKAMEPIPADYADDKHWP